MQLLLLLPLLLLSLLPLPPVVPAAGVLVHALVLYEYQNNNLAPVLVLDEPCPRIQPHHPVSTSLCLLTLVLTAAVDTLVCLHSHPLILIRIRHAHPQHHCHQEQHRSA